MFGGIRALSLVGVLVLALIGMVALAGCGEDDAAEVGGTLVIAEDQAPPILNVLLADGATVTGQRVVSNVLQNLLTADAAGSYVPQLAERVPSGADVARGPTRVTFRIREEARWSDGRPVSAADVAFTWRTMTDPGVAVASRAGWSEIAAVRAGVAADGSACPRRTCVTVRFRGDYAPWREVFSVSGGNYLLPRHALAGEDFNRVWNAGEILGSGPFTVESYEPGVRAVLRRDDDYWGSADAGGGPFLERMVFNFLDAPVAALNALRAGEAGAVSPPPDPDLIARARRIDGVAVQAVPSVFYEHLMLNTERSPVNDVRVRRALAYAIDRGEIVEVLLDGEVPVLQSQLRPFQLGYAPVFERYGRDPDRARELLEEAGYSAGPDGVYVRGDRPLEIELVTVAGNELRRRVAELIAAQAAEAGFRIVYQPEPPQRLFGNSLVQGDYTLAMLAFGGSLDSSPRETLASASIPSPANGFAGQNFYRWRNAEADALIARSDAEIDDGARAAQLGELQELLAADVPLIPLYQQTNTIAYRSELEGVDQSPTQIEAFWNTARWSLSSAGG